MDQSVIHSKGNVGMKRIITAVIAAAAILCSCEPNSISVIDNSFAFSAKSSANGTQNYVSLTLESGSKESRYEVSYLIDDDPSLTLTDDQSSEFKSGSHVDFRSGSIIWALPQLRKGEHSISFTIRTDEYEQKINHKFSITAEPFSLHAEVRSDLSAGTSTLLLSLAEGIADKDYTVTVLVDGKVIDENGFKVNFKETPIYSVVIPLIRPGSHEITVRLGDGMSQEETTFLFSEPLRYQGIDVEISRSPSTGKTRFMVRSNPYGLSVAVKDSLVVKGRCDYHVCSWIEDKTDYKTEYKEICDIAHLDRFVPVVGRWYDLTDSQGKETLMTSQSIANSTWEARWSNTGEGGWDYYQVPDGLSYFKVESSTHNMIIDFEKLLGVTVNITNSERDVVVNGKPISTRHSYQL